MIATLTARGLGDCLMLTDLPHAAKEVSRVAHVWAHSPYFIEVMKYHPSYQFTDVDCGVVNPFLVDVLRLNECYDLGNGHQLQRLRRAWRLPVDLKPAPAMKRSMSQVHGRVILHFDASPKNVNWQRKHWHPRMRELYSESKIELEKFIKSRRDLEFIEVGRVSSEITGAQFRQPSSTEELIETVHTGEYFIGIMSGPMHLAAAAGIKSIVVCNYPKASQIVLPCLKWTGTPEEEWMYPQNVHLHQEGDSPLVPKLTRDSLQAAFNGDVYPFWEDTWLGLINETTRF